MGYTNPDLVIEYDTLRLYIKGVRQYGLVMIMAKQLLIVFLLATCLSLATAYICSDDANSKDAFETHGCFCGTATSTLAHPRLFDKYYHAFDGCHDTSEKDIDPDDNIVECALDAAAPVLNRTALSEIPVVPNGAEIYRDIRCL